MKVGVFSGRNYRGKRRNYCFDVAYYLAINGPQTFTGILTGLSINEGKKSIENVENIKRRLRGSVERALNKLHEYEYISGRNVINKYQRNKYELTIKGILSVLIYINKYSITDGFKIKFTLNYDNIKIVPFRVHLVEDFEILNEQIDYIKQLMPINFIILLWMHRVKKMFHDSDLDNIQLSTFKREIDLTASYAHFVIKNVLNIKGLLSVSFFLKTDINSYTNKINSWLNEYEIKDSSKINKEEIIIDKGKIVISNYESDLVVFSNVIQKSLLYMKDSNESVNQNLSFFYVDENYL